MKTSIKAIEKILKEEAGENALVPVKTLQMILSDLQAVDWMFEANLNTKNKELHQFEIKENAYISKNNDELEVAKLEVEHAYLSDEEIKELRRTASSSYLQVDICMEAANKIRTYIKAQKKVMFLENKSHVCAIYCKACDDKERISTTYYKRCLLAVDKYIKKHNFNIKGGI